MTFSISQLFFYYWILSIIFEAVYCFYLWKQAKKKLAKYPSVAVFLNALKSVASAQLILKKIFGPLGYSIGFVLLCIISPVMFPFSIITLFKKLIGYKSKLEKKAEEELKDAERAEQRSNDFMRNEGRGIFWEDEQINPN